jgi:Rieske Fe-S protein
MERRKFLKTGCTFCLLGSLGMMLPVSVEAKGKRKVFKTEVVDNKIEVPLTEFAESNIVILRIKRWDYDVAVEKMEDNTYSAILLKCTHMENGLNVSGGGYMCSMHGSEFDKQGAVVKGPAEMPLTKYAVTTNENSLTINTQL